MTDQIGDVKKFHRCAGVVDGAIADGVLNLRRKLCEEEARELAEAFGFEAPAWRRVPRRIEGGLIDPRGDWEDADEIGIADAVTDLAYVALGTLIHLWGERAARRVWNEVQRSNMAKFPDGIAMLDSDGKVLKPPSWTPPDIAGAIAGTLPHEKVRSNQMPQGWAWEDAGLILDAECETSLELENAATLRIGMDDGKRVKLVPLACIDLLVGRTVASAEAEGMLIRIDWALADAGLIGEEGREVESIVARIERLAETARRLAEENTALAKTIGDDAVRHESEAKANRMRMDGFMSEIQEIADRMRLVRNEKMTGPDWAHEICNVLSSYVDTPLNIRFSPESKTRVHPDARRRGSAPRCTCPDGFDGGRGWHPDCILHGGERPDPAEAPSDDNERKYAESDVASTGARQQCAATNGDGFLCRRYRHDGDRHRFPPPMASGDTIEDGPYPADKINPPHYDGDACMRCIARVTAEMSGAAAFCVGQAIKYIWRAGRKPSEPAKSDIEKAKWYLDWRERNSVVMGDREARVIKQIEDIIGFAAPELWREKLEAL